MMSRDEKAKMEIQTLIRGLELEYPAFRFSVHTDTSFHASGAVSGRIAFMVTHHFGDECQTVYRTGDDLKKRPSLSDISRHATNASMMFEKGLSGGWHESWDKWRAVHAEAVKGGDQ